MAGIMRRWCAFIGGIGALSMAGPAAVWGQENEASSRPRRQPIEITQFLGGSATQRSALHVMQPAIGTDATVAPVNWKGNPFRGSVYYGVRVSTFLPKNPRLGFEFDYLHYKVYAKAEESAQFSGTWLGEPIDTIAPINSRIGRFQITNGVNAMTLGVLYRERLQRSPSFPNGRCQPYIGGGPAFYYLYAINRINGRNVRERYEAGTFGLTLQAGLRYGLSSHFGLFAEGRYTSYHARVNVADNGHATTPLRTWHSLIGLGYGF